MQGKSKADECQPLETASKFFSFILNVVHHCIILCHLAANLQKGIKTPKFRVGQWFTPGGWWGVWRHRSWRRGAGGRQWARGSSPAWSPSHSCPSWLACWVRKITIIEIHKHWTLHKIICKYGALLDSRTFSVDWLLLTVHTTHSHPKRFAVFKVNIIRNVVPHITYKMLEMYGRHYFLTYMTHDVSCAC